MDKDMRQCLEKSKAVNKMQESAHYYNSRQINEALIERKTCWEELVGRNNERTIQLREI